MAKWHRKAPTCSAQAKSTGKKCTRPAIKGGKVCRYHGGSAPQVKRKADERIAEYVAKMVDPDRVLREAARLAFSDIRQAFNDKGELLPIHEWPDDLAAAVASTESVRRNLDAADGKTDRIVKLKVWDKPKNIEMLSKHLGLLTERVEVTLQGELEDRIKAGRGRIAKAGNGHR